MGKLKYVLIVSILLLGLLASSGCSFSINLKSSENPSSTNIPTGAINPHWVPSYIEETAGLPLSEAELVQKMAPVVVSIFSETIKYNVFMQPYQFPWQD